MMTKLNLKVGYLVVCKNNEKAIVMADKNDELILCFENQTWMNCPKQVPNIRDFRCEIEISKVYNRSDIKAGLILFNENMRDILWQFEEPVIEMTIAEIEAKLGVKNLKIIKENDNG